ncbi:response regulator [Polymorphobacter sp. PAMC 29334]|uniref:ATP-binding protein n=1 Tax=Polymorphobacter sp. PAMC 29334 TaxID=2862331 RepID=UPI001C76191C|nr:ATP-binding protein [Polymorphobacter sp. PAMC 29334]QYE34288.1 response regulator [Polymorphobacter sp. PAMC 29334]
MNILPLGLALLDGGGQCIQTNAVFNETVGSDCTSGDGILALAVEDDRAQLAKAIVQVLDGTVDGQEVRLRLAARPDETVVVTLAPAPANWGFAALIAVRDIREQVRLEQQVAQATKMQAVGQLAGGIAHDFNNILTAILGLCDQLLDRHPEGTPDFEDIDQVRQNGNRAANLVRQLLAFARQQTLRPQVLDVASVIDALKPLLRRLVGPDVDLIVVNHGGAGAVRADPGQLEQVLVNLSVNARDAMSAKGRLTITIRGVPAAEVPGLGHRIIPTIDLVAISVSDTGTGIPPEIAAKIFEPFFTTKPVGQGTGLGLSTVYGIVKQTGGFVFAEPVAEGGTCFVVYLPASAAPAVVPVAQRPRQRPPLMGTVLLVEDDRAVRLVVERALRRHGLGVIALGDASTALDLIEQGETLIDLLVSDVVMPGMDGVDLLRRARARCPALPVVLMSGYAEPPQRRALVRAGVVFLPKPFSVEDLLDAVHTALAAVPLDMPLPPSIGA